MVMYFIPLLLNNNHSVVVDIDHSYSLGRHMSLQSKEFPAINY